jgi:hypothetical protein
LGGLSISCSNKEWPDLLRFRAFGVNFPESFVMLAIFAGFAPGSWNFPESFVMLAIFADFLRVLGIF